MDSKDVKHFNKIRKLYLNRIQVDSLFAHSYLLDLYDNDPTRTHTFIPRKNIQDVIDCVYMEYNLSAESRLLLDRLVELLDV